VGKAAKEEVDHSRVYSAEIKNEWSSTSRLRTSLQSLTFYRITRICNIHSKNYTISKLNKMNLLETLKKRRVVSVYAMKAYGGSRVVAPPISNLGTR
jgi:hypothetical protein